MDRTRLKGTAIAGAAVLALGAGATIAAGYGPVGGSSSQGNGPPQQPTNQGVGPGGTGGQGDGPQRRSGGRYVIGAWLGADQQAPPLTGLDDAHGKFEAKLNRRGRGGMWVGNAKLNYENLTGLANNAAHIHMGVPGTTGPIVINICGTTGTPTCSDGVRTPISITNDQLIAIKSGASYVDVHTAANMDGEIRGRLGSVYRVIANLTVGQVRPRPARPRRGATGRLRGYLVKYGDQGHLDTTLTYRRLSGPASAAHLHRGARRRTGPVGVTLCNGTPQCKTGVTGMHEVGGTFLTKLLRGRTYVNVHTARNADGEIRGQVRTPRAR